MSIFGNYNLGEPVFAPDQCVVTKSCMGKDPFRVQDKPTGFTIIID